MMLITAQKGMKKLYKVCMYVHIHMKLIKFYLEDKVHARALKIKGLKTWKQFVTGCIYQKDMKK